MRLPHGQIDADQELGVWVGVVPGRGLLAGLLEHSTAERDDTAGLLGEFDEVVRCQPAEGGMPPAYERLDPADGAVGEADEGLVFQSELVAFEAR